MYIVDTATVKGKCRKLSPSWKGPGKVVKKLSPYLYRVKTKAAVMVAYHDRLKKYPVVAVVLQREVPESYARGGGHSSFPAQGEPPPPSSDSPVSSPPPGTPVAVPQPKRKRGRPRKAPGTSSTSNQSPDPSSDTSVLLLPPPGRRPADGPV